MQSKDWTIRGRIGDIGIWMSESVTYIRLQKTAFDTTGGIFLFCFVCSDIDATNTSSTTSISTVSNDCCKKRHILNG